MKDLSPLPWRLERTRRGTWRVLSGRLQRPIAEIYDGTDAQFMVSVAIMAEALEYICGRLSPKSSSGIAARTALYRATRDTGILADLPVSDRDKILAQYCAEAEVTQ